MTFLAIPNVGNYAIAFGALAESLEVEPWISTSISPEALALGVKHAPETACLPFKAFLGHFLQASNEGVKYAVMVNSVGPCRLRYYAPLQRKILKDLGNPLYVFGLGFEGIKPPIVKFFDPGRRIFIRGVTRFWWKVQAVDVLEDHTWRARAREIHVGAASALLEECLQELLAASTVKAIRAFIKEIPGRFAAIEIDETRVTLKVGLLGECDILRDKFLNHNVEETLGSLGIEVRNFFQMGSEVKNIFDLGFLNQYSEKNQLKKAYPYMQTIGGGHALDSVANAIRCAEDGFDGLVHLCPSGCMPEVSIRPILQRVSRDKDLPLLELSFDEHTSDTAVNTRLEAFTDILFDRRLQRDGQV